MIACMFTLRARRIAWDGLLGSQLPLVLLCLDDESLPYIVVGERGRHLTGYLVEYGAM